MTELLELRPGMTIWSATLAEADDQIPEFRTKRGGTIVASTVTSDGEVSFRVARLHHGRIVYDTIVSSDIDLEELAFAEVNRRTIGGLTKAMAAEMVTSTSKQAEHLRPMTVLLDAGGML